MAGKPVALKNHMHICPMIDPGPRPHIGGPILKPKQNYVKVNGIPIATVGDKTMCTGVLKKAKITSGSTVAKIDGKKVARMLDSCQHGGKIVQGKSWITFE